jgi:hypothetical protein
VQTYINTHIHHSAYLHFVHAHTYLHPVGNCATVKVMEWNLKSHRYTAQPFYICYLLLWTVYCRVTLAYLEGLHLMLLELVAQPNCFLIYTHHLYNIWHLFDAIKYVCTKHRQTYILFVRLKINILRYYTLHICWFSPSCDSILTNSRHDPVRFLLYYRQQNPS